MSNRVFAALAGIVAELRERNVSFALVGGLAVSVRAEPRFTADVDLAITVSADNEVELLAHQLTLRGYQVRALVEHKSRGRIATVRLLGRHGVVIDLIAATCGIEPEIVEAATPVLVENAGELPVAQPADLVAMKLLSATPRRAQDMLDARSLLLSNAQLDIEHVRRRLELIRARGFDRDEDLDGKLRALLADVAAERLD